MFGIHNYAGFVAAVVLFQIVPGPGAITILTSTARGGVRAGMAAVLGTLTGDFLFMLGAVMGLAAMLAARPLLLSGLQWVGIGYLCWLGTRLLLSGDRENKGSVAVESPRSHFRTALSVCLTNPKASMFFLAFFPLFLTRGAEPWVLGLMMVHVSVISLVYQTGLVLVGNALSARLGNIRPLRSVARRLAGAAMIGFGIRLAFNRR